VSHCGSCKYDPQSIACYAATRPRLCELIHVMGRTDYAEIVDQLTLEPPPPPPVPDDLDFDFGQQSMTVDGESPPNPWQAARLARNACEHYARSCTGCDGGDCTRPDKAGPTDLAKCAACLGMPLPKRGAS